MNRQEIEKICKKYKIQNWTLNDDGSIDVDDDVHLWNIGFIKLPLKFRNVKGSFCCNGNNLISLEGAPESVGGSFDCTANKLKSLEGAPLSVGGDFWCRYNDFNIDDDRDDLNQPYYKQYLRDYKLKQILND